STRTSGTQITSTCKFAGNPAIDLFLEDIERQAAVLKDHVMEGTDPEPVPHRCPGAFAQCNDLEHAKLVTKRLTRPDDIAFDLGRGLVHMRAFRRGHIVDGLFAGPFLGMDAGID